jgi:hypothetical protein
VVDDHVVPLYVNALPQSSTVIQNVYPGTAKTQNGDTGECSKPGQERASLEP